MPDYRVTLEAAWMVRDVDSVEDAIGIAISEAGKRLQPSAKFVDVALMTMPCPYCDEDITSALMVSRVALVGLWMRMKVFRAENENHADRIAKMVIGRALRDIPLSSRSVELCSEAGEA